MSAFAFSEGLMEDLERLQGGGRSGKRGRSDRRGTMKLAQAIGRSIPPTSHLGGGGGGGVRQSRVRAFLERFTRSAPPVVFKVMSRLKSSGDVLGAFTYIGHIGDKELEPTGIETSDGEVLTDARDMQKLAREWQEHEEAGADRRKGTTAFSTAFSMPPGTDPEAVLGAVRAIADLDLANRRWALALHTNASQPHVHVIFAGRDNSGRRFHPDRDFLAFMRERFAEELRERGIEADATMRKTRGIPTISERTAVVKIREAYEKGERARGSKADDGKRAMLAGRAADNGMTLEGRHSARSKAAVIQDATKRLYGRAVDELRASGGCDEVALAHSIERLVEAMPEVKDARTDMKARLREAGQSIATAADRFAVGLAKLDEILERRTDAKFERKDEAPQPGAVIAQERLERGLASLAAYRELERARGASQGQKEGAKTDAGPGDAAPTRAEQLQARIDALNDMLKRREQAAASPEATKGGAAEQLRGLIDGWPDRQRALQQQKDRERDRDRDKEPER